MDKRINDFLESGQLELYVLGSLSNEESKLVEGMIAQHPSVKQEYDRIQNEIESLATAHAVEPPVELRAKIMDKLDTNLDQKQSNLPSNQNWAWILSGLLALTSLFFVIRNNTLGKELKQSKDQYAILERSCSERESLMNNIYAEHGIMMNSSSQTARSQRRSRSIPSRH